MRNKPHLTRWLITLVIPIGWAVLFIFPPWAVTPQHVYSLLFLGALPLINALFDWMSYAIALTLLRLRLRARLLIINGIAGLALAMVLFLALGACLTALITAVSALAQTRCLTTFAPNRQITIGYI